MVMPSLILYSTNIVRSFTRRTQSFPLISGRNVVHLVTLLMKAWPLRIHMLWRVTIHQQLATSCQLLILSMISRKSLRSCALWTRWLVLVISSHMTPSIVSVCHVAAYYIFVLYHVIYQTLTNLVFSFFHVYVALNGQPCMVLRTEYFRLLDIVNTERDIVVEVTALVYQKGRLSSNRDSFVCAHEVVFGPKGMSTCNHSM